MSFDPKLYHRRSIRLQSYDYSSPGVYFVTICVRARECIFGEIVGWRHGLIRTTGVLWSKRGGDCPGSLGMSNSLSAIVQNFKSVSAKKINQLRQSPGSLVWQRNYYEHIVRTISNERKLSAIRQYIKDNPMQWELDSENPRKQ